MFKVSGNYNPPKSPFEAIQRGYSKLEPDFVEKARGAKDAPIDKFIRYSKKIITERKTFKVNNIIKRFLSKIGIK